MDDPAWLIALGAMAAFAVFWCAVCGLISLFGWRSLAQHYRSERPFTGPTRTGQSGQISFARYNGVLTVGGDETGLSLGVMALFRTGHPPLFIPWHEVVALRECQWLFVKYLELHFRLTGVKVRLRWPAAEFVRGAAGRGWPGVAAIPGA